MKRLSPFSVILLFTALSLLGVAALPSLDLRYEPADKGATLTLSSSWPGASAKVMESEVTSLLERLVSTVNGVGDMESVSKKGSSSVTFTVKDRSKLDAVRFEISSLIRQSYNKFPKGVSYPQIGGNSSGEGEGAALVYTFNANLPTIEIERYIKSHLVDNLSQIEGVDCALTSGSVPYSIEVEYDADLMQKYNLSYSDLQSAVSSLESVTEKRLEQSLGEIPVKREGSRIIRVSDVAKVSYREREPSSYSRLNGLNTVSLYIYLEKGANAIKVCNAVKSRMNLLQDSFPQHFSATLNHDTSLRVKDEIHKIVRRALLSILILLLFVWIVSRSLAYLSTIAISILVTNLIAILLYSFFGVQINVYSLAGITVALGIVIDAAIVMASHYAYYKDRGAFIPLCAAQATTICALFAMWLLPQEYREIFSDFGAVVIINLAVSLLVSFFLVPALSDALIGGRERSRRSLASGRRIASFNRWYERYARFAKRRWWLVTLLFLLLLGASAYLFAVNAKSGFYKVEQRKVIMVRASLPDGCTISQLNEAVLSLENYLSQFEEIESFITNIRSHSNAFVSIYFDKSVEKSSFPEELKRQIIEKVQNLGGASWMVSGVDDNPFSNVLSVGKVYNDCIMISGYNYDRLYNFCKAAADTILKESKVLSAGVYSGRLAWGRSFSNSEFYVEYSKEALARHNISPVDAFTALNENIKSREVANLFYRGAKTPVEIISNRADEFGLWNIRNEHIKIGESFIPFSDIGSVTLAEGANDIVRKNKVYTLMVAYYYSGSEQRGKEFRNSHIERLNSLLPAGFNAWEDTYEEGKIEGGSYSLLGIIVLIIFFFCSVVMESLKYPFAIIVLIPVSFTGLFALFGATEFAFDQGGFAALVMLSGLVVNAGIYLVYEMRLQQKRRCGSYIRAFNHKIVPILLTVISTVLGLVPFLLDGPSEVFWFAFACGTISGLVYSLAVIFFLLPIFMPLPESFRRVQVPL